MAVISNRIIGVTFEGDVDAPNLAYPAAENASSPGQVIQQALLTGANTVNVPPGATAGTIIPPAGNTATIILKGIITDTGVYLHPTDPTSLSIQRNNSSTFVLTVSSAVTVRIIWS